MSKINELDFEVLLNLFEKIIDAKIDEKIKSLGLESSSYGVISSLDKTKTDTDGNVTEVVRASVKLATGETVNNLFNATGQILNVGDNVKVYGSQSDIQNRYIGLKYEREVVSYAERVDS